MTALRAICWRAAIGYVLIRRSTGPRHKVDRRPVVAVQLLVETAKDVRYGATYRLFIGDVISQFGPRKSQELNIPPPGR